MVAAFASDALVNDIQREFWGPDAIRRWADREIIGDVIVSAAVDGDYDKTGLPDPLVLTFYFSLDGGQISRLIIAGNKPGY
jgi:hypothetical protein